MNPDVRRVLIESQVAFKVHEHPRLVSFEELTRSLPFNPSGMVKGLVFRVGPGYAIVAMLAADRVDYKKIADYFGIRRHDLRAATPQELEVDLGMEVGGVAPFPVAGTRLVFDTPVGELGVVYCGTGRNTSTLEISAKDLLAITAGTLGNFSKERAVSS